MMGAAPVAATPTFGAVGVTPLGEAVITVSGRTEVDDRAWLEPWGKSCCGSMGRAVMPVSVVGERLSEGVGEMADSSPRLDWMSVRN